MEDFEPQGLIIDDGLATVNEDFLSQRLPLASYLTSMDWGSSQINDASQTWPFGQDLDMDASIP